MKVVFEGTMAEFRSVFGRVVAEFEPSGLEAELEAELLPADDEEGIPGPEDKLPELSPGVRHTTSVAFKELCLTWVQGFEDEEAEQPDRLRALQDVGTGPTALAVIIMAHERGSLQRLIEHTLLDHNPAVAAGYGTSEAWLDYIDRLSGNMVQVSHLAFPDLVSVHDYSTKWRKQ